MLIPKQKWNWYKSALSSQLKTWWKTFYSPERWLSFSYLQNFLLLNKHLFVFQNEVFIFGKWCLSPQGISDCWAKFVWFCLEQNSIIELGCVLHVFFFFFFKLSSLSEQVIQEISYQRQRKQLLFKIIRNYLLPLLTQKRQLSSYMLY